jgi:hypothetical protein
MHFGRRLDLSVCGQVVVVNRSPNYCSERSKDRTGRVSKACAWRILALSAAALPLDTRAAEPTVEPTNHIAIRYLEAEVRIERPVPSERLFPRFFEEVVSSDSMVFDRFAGPSSQLGWERKQNLLGYQAFDRFNAHGANLFATIAMDSLRTAAAAALPLDLWQENWERGLGRFLTGTVGNPEEEHVRLRSISYSAVRSTWERANENAGIQWGVRPWRTSPYLYFLAHAGRLDGQRLLTLEARAGYTLFGSTQIEGRLALQLPGSFRIAGGGAVNPARLGVGDPEATHLSFTLERVLGSRRDAKGVFFVGFRSGVNRTLSNPRQENLVLAGLSRPW